MPVYYYGTVPVLAWIINHFLYGGVHYAWLAEEFHPLTTNPKSSNPYLICGDLYAAWVMRDEWDKYVDATRRSMRRGARTLEKAGKLDPALGRRIRRICRTADIRLFYPVVYRVDMRRISPERHVRANSGLLRSREVLVPDLASEEFELLFCDNREDELLFSFTAPGPRARNNALSPLELLEENCDG